MRKVQTKWQVDKKILKTIFYYYYYFKTVNQLASVGNDLNHSNCLSKNIKEATYIPLLKEKTLAENLERVMLGVQ